MYSRSLEINQQQTYRSWRFYVGWMRGAHAYNYFLSHFLEPEVRWFLPTGNGEPITAVTSQLEWRYNILYHIKYIANSLDSQCGEPVFSVMVAGWFCEKSVWIGKVEDVKPVLRKKRISTGNHFEEEDFYPDELWNRRISSDLIHVGPDIISF